MIEIFVWILLTLLVASISAVIAKKHGPEYIIGLYASMVVIANVLANKIVTFLWWEIDAGTIVYSTIFLLTDMLSEFYGKKTAKKAVWTGFFANVMLGASVWIAINWQPAASWGNQAAFAATLGNTYRIIIASMIAYLISQHHDVWAYNFWKKVTKGKHLWLRNNASTAVSQLLDSVIFVTIAFYGVFPIFDMIIGLYIVKLIIASVDTPYLYAVKWYYGKKKPIKNE
jgi:queuosine precursor transporter